MTAPTLRARAEAQRAGRGTEALEAARRAFPGASDLVAAAMAVLRACDEAQESEVAPSVLHAAEALRLALRQAKP